MSERLSGERCKAQPKSSRAVSLAVALCALWTAYNDTNEATLSLIGNKDKQAEFIDTGLTLVTTANVQHWDGGLDGFVDLLNGRDHKAVCVQEAVLSGLRQVVEKTGYNAVFVRSGEYLGGNEYGNAILSREDIRLVDSAPLPAGGNVIEERWHNRQYMIVEIGGSRPMTLLNTHLATTSALARKQVEFLGDVVQHHDVDVMCADFNLDVPSLAKSGLGRYFGEDYFHPPPTAPINYPTERIDAVLFREGVEPFMSFSQGTGADHNAAGWYGVDPAEDDRLILATIGWD